MSAFERVRAYIEAYADAPNWGGPTMYPSPPSVADLRLLLTSASSGDGLREQVVRQCAKIAHAYANGQRQMAVEEGWDDGLRAGLDTAEHIERSIRALSKSSEAVRTAGMEEAAREVDYLARIAKASPFWPDGCAEEIKKVAGRIRALIATVEDVS